MVEAVSSGYLPLSFVYAARYGGQDRITVPVLPSQALYANFQHILGVPAQKGAATYGIDRLQVLEVLLEQLESAKTQAPPVREAPADFGASGVDALIGKYGGELHALATAPARPYAQAPTLAPGAIFSIAA
ncbi:MAG TPA: hypothetical protein VMV90_15685 [Rectinemataceae bacterium]|nr:hypothetical protein [Rectinemataceae bacterium]